MHNIYHYFQINCPIEKVFQGISEPELIDQWWAKKTEGTVETDAHYKLGFGLENNWEAKVIVCNKPTKFGLIVIKAHEDWVNTVVKFDLFSNGKEQTSVHFYHNDWRVDNEHYRISNYCWAMGLRILKRYLEHGEVVQYEDRLNV
ncbi:MAG TPA: SRPBCC domain-containing protein [Eudoraea sp.]|nr:SRPBCC domain-containing protein [Eudoraea sp.]